MFFIGEPVPTSPEHALAGIATLPDRPGPRSLFHRINDGGFMQHPYAALSIALSADLRVIARQHPADEFMRPVSHRRLQPAGPLA